MNLFISNEILNKCKKIYKIKIGKNVKILYNNFKFYGTEINIKDGRCLDKNFETMLILKEIALSYYFPILGAN